MGSKTEQVQLDCYFFVGEGTDEDRKMEAWCLDCRGAKRPNTGWFWNGSTKGYGPWDIKCHACGKYIHRVKK
jgi:hypothetical protein